MNKLKNIKNRTEAPLAVTAKSPSKSSNDFGRTVRETVESIVIAFVLAFLFRTFEAEAFVIPTGSMAPTLQGRHKDVTCAKCGYRVRASASDEERAAEQANNRDDYSQEQASRLVNNAQVVTVTCPLCRYKTEVDPDPRTGEDDPSYNGDRIIVAKFPFEFVDPKRWDVVVFKFPNDAKTNYIKRLVGLPEETVKIFHGDIFTRKKGETEWLIERKQPDKQRAMAQIVYDNDYVVKDLTDKGWPLRWQMVPPEKDAKDGWQTLDNGKAFEIKSAGDGESWLRYQHFVPTDEDWRKLREGPLPRDYHPKPQLITDFSAYNNGALRGSPPPNAVSLGLHWVGDLMLQTTVTLSDVDAQASDKLLLDLVKGGKHFRATIDVKTGEAKFAIDGLPDYQPTAKTSITGPGTYRLIFANFDRQLTLWVNGSPVLGGPETEYPTLDNETPVSTAEDPADLAPAGIAVEGKLTAKVSHLRVLRDIYYIADKIGRIDNWPLTDYEFPQIPTMGRERFAEFLSTPSEWSLQDTHGYTPFDYRRSVEFPLEKDQFFVLGDNSLASADSRLWSNQHYVGRELMIGKALFIYWPHSWDQIPGTGIPCPFFPNFGDMGFVR